MEIYLLGLVEAFYEGQAVALGGAKPRALLAILALQANAPVSADRLIEGLWGERPPATAHKAVQVLVSQLRKHLAGADAEIVTRGRGYALRVDPEAVDALRFERLLRSGANGSQLRDALALWRGPPLDDLADEPFAAAEIRRLEDLWLGAREAAIEEALADGRHADVVAELEDLVGEHPLRERLHGQRMRALYGCGRQADALAAFRHFRQLLLDQVGLEPGPQLRHLNDAILGQDPELDGPGQRRLEPAILTRGSELAGSPGAVGERGLPAAPNRTVGREHELDALAARLRTRSVRLLTLTGPGGVGKTRLALEVARAAAADFADGAHLVALAAVERPEAVSAAIIRALGIVALADESPGQAVERFLTSKQLLLVTDNFEHVLAAAPFISGLLKSSPGLTVLATSREPLALHAEERYPVTPLALPELATADGRDTLAGVDAVALFIERARAHDPDFELDDRNSEAVAEICRRVDGLPLAIELAAARCGLLSPAEIAERLDVALSAPGPAVRDAPARHHTLRATVDWSHQLLSEGERGCFARFAVFAGGATIESAQTITGASLDTLDHLVAKSLLVRRRRRGTPTRLQMLETIRGYAAERFSEAEERDDVCERHYRYFVALAERHGTDQALMGVDGKRHLTHLDQEIHNFDAALRWALGQPDAGPALAIVVALGSYWQLRDRYADAVDWIDRALSMPGVEDHPAEQARALLAKAAALRWRGRIAEQPAILAEAQAVARALGDPLLLAQVLNACAASWSVTGRWEAADPVADEALRYATAADDKWEIAQAWTGKASAVSSLSELRERVDRAAVLLEDVGNVVRLGQLYCDAAYGALALGGDRDARELADRAAPLVRDLENPGTWMILQGNTGLGALLAGDTEAARDAFREELEICRKLVALPIASEGLIGLAAVAVVAGDLRQAARLRGAATAHGYGQQQDAIEARLEAAFFATARYRHGAEAWDAAMRSGAELSFADAIACALGELGNSAAPVTKR